MRILKVLLVVLCIWGAWNWRQSRSLTDLSPGAVAAEAPLQSDTDASAFNSGNYQITPLADFHIRARILSRKDYSSGKEAELSPIDLALGWGRMSDPEIYGQLDISQGGRFYHWRYENEPPIPTDEIVRSSANMHMIPANATVEAELRKARPGQVISIEGYLVYIQDPSGWRWRSSLSRKDSGNGACEVIWVNAVSIESPT